MRRLDGGGDRIRIMTVDGNRVPVDRLEAGDLVSRVRQRHGAVDGDRIIVPEEDELVQLEVTGKRDRLLADALHQAAVAGRSEEHTSELQSLMRISYAVF